MSTWAPEHTLGSQNTSKVPFWLAKHTKLSPWLEAWTALVDGKMNKSAPLGAKMHILVPSKEPKKHANMPFWNQKVHKCPCESQNTH